MKKLARLTWDRLSIYLPVMLMGLLALGTYWLVRITPTTSAPEPEQQVRREPDYFMRTFSVKTFNEKGQLQSEVNGIEGRHFPDTDTLEIDQVRMRSFNQDGKVVVATADRALSNSDGSEVQLFGNAIVVREASTDASGRVDPPLEFRSEFLHAYVNTERVKTNQPVVMTRGNDRFTGDAMDFDNLSRVMNLQGRVRGVLMPGPAKSAK